jgi:voltage-gated potassium channel Kch
MSNQSIESQLLSHEVEISSDLPFRKWLYAWLLDPHIEGNHQKSIDHWIGLLIVANLFALVFEHVPAIFEPNQVWFHYFDVISVLIFTIEYAVRFYLAPEDEEFKKHRFARARYASSPFAIIDLVAILPFFLQAFISIDLRFLRFLRLLRILKLFRVLIPAYKEFVQANKGRTFRQKMHALVFPSEYGGELHHMFDTFIVIWVIISVLAVIFESVHSIHYLLNLEFLILDAIAVSIFTIEYCLRLYCCVEEPGYQRAVAGRLKLAKSTSSIIDLLAIAPFFLEVFLHHLFDLRFMRVFRLLRLLKLTRYTGATQSLSKVVAREWPVMAASAFIMLLLVVMTASLGYLFEHEAQPEKFENIPQSIYWAVITLASVGYGDISPVTPAGRAMTIVLALIGIGIFAIPAALLSSAFSDQLKMDREALVNKLYEMLSDGNIDESEAEYIKHEAKRLHLSDEEVRVLIEKAKRERELMDDVSVLPLHKIASNPEHTVEHYKYLLGQIRQLSLLSDQEQLNQTLAKPDRLTDTDKQLWRLINRQEAPPT